MQGRGCPFPTVNSPTQKLKTLSRLLPRGELSFDPEVLAAHAGDKWFAAHQPDAVALPRSTASVAAVLRFADRHRIPVTPRGAGHGYVGGCVPVRGGIVLSLARMNKIKEISPADFVAVVEPGVKTEVLQAAVKSVGCFTRPTPPAGRKALLAAISPRMPEGRGALSMASRAITFWAWKWSWRTARCCA